MPFLMLFCKPFYLRMFVSDSHVGGQRGRKKSRKGWPIYPRSQTLLPSSLFTSCVKPLGICEHASIGFLFKTCASGLAAMMCINTPSQLLLFSLRHTLPLGKYRKCSGTLPCAGIPKVLPTSTCSVLSSWLLRRVSFVHIMMMIIVASRSEVHRWAESFRAQR
jgi:hypothetical protein